MIWAFDFKHHKQQIIQYKYDRKYGRVFSVLKNGLLVAMGKDKDSFELNLQDSFGKLKTPNMALFRHLELLQGCFSHFSKIHFLTPLDHPIKVTGLDCCNNFSSCVVTASYKNTNYLILIKIMHKVLQKNFTIEDIYKSRTNRTNSKNPFQV